MEGRWCTALTSHGSEVKQVLSQVGGLCSGSLTCLSVFARVHSMPGSIFQKAQMAELCSGMSRARIVSLLLRLATNSPQHFFS